MKEANLDQNQVSTLPLSCSCVSKRPIATVRNLIKKLSKETKLTRKPTKCFPLTEESLHVCNVNNYIQFVYPISYPSTL